MGDVRSGLHRIYLIRHGETVDNVAGLYGGVRDSALTNHGVQQALRLAQYFANNGVVFSHVFSSDLSRAWKTADAIRATQAATKPGTAQARTLAAVQLPELREQDYGYYEGKPFSARVPNRAQHKQDPEFQDVESIEAVARRADNFLDRNLLPLLSDAGPGQRLVVAVVSHGMLLAALWRCILRRQLPNTVSLSADLAATRSLLSLANLGGWSNTGYLELELSKCDQVSGDSGASRPDAAPNPTASQEDTFEQNEATVEAKQRPTTKGALDTVERETASKSAPISKFAILVREINSREHLKELKRTGGGIGSAKSDDSQRSIETFFKRKKPG